MVSFLCSPSCQEPDTEFEGEEDFVFLKQRATDVAVDAASKVIIEVVNALLQVGGLGAVSNRLKVEVDEPHQ